MSDGMRRELVYLSSYATNRYFIPNWGNGIQHRLAPEGVKLAGMYNIRQSDDNKRTSDEFTFVGCFPVDNPKYTIGMVVIRPHKLPATFCILSKE